MVQNFAVFLIICISGGSLGTTTSPQQQDTATLQDLCKKLALGHGFPGIPGSNGMPGIPGAPGPQGPQGREGVKGQIGDTGSKGMPGPKGDRGREGPPGKSGLTGIKGIKGEPGLVRMKGEQGVKGVKGDRGIVGNQGRKGNKGEKGEGAKASQASVAPQTNWKQCVWKSSSGTDNGQIKECTFNKLMSDTSLKVSFHGNMRVRGNYKCNRWYFKINGSECSRPATIEALVYNEWPSGNLNNEQLHHRSFEGYCENIPQGAVRVELWVGTCGGQRLGDAYTGWNSVSRIMIEEVSRPQS